MQVILSRIHPINFCLEETTCLFYGVPEDHVSSWSFRLAFETEGVNYLKDQATVSV